MVAQGTENSPGLTADGRDTLLVLEHGGKTTHWMAPTDLTVDEAVEALSDSSVPGHPTLSEGWLAIKLTQAGRHGGFSNGHVEFLPDSLSDEQARSALAISGAGMDDFARIDHRTVALETRWRYSRIYSVGLFVGLALWPGLAKWRRRLANPRSE